MNNLQWTNSQQQNFLNFLKSFNLNTTNINWNYFQQAFIHPSYSYENHLNYDYQKLEFYGDALIEKEISTYLFNKNNLNEGQMTSYRIKMVCHATMFKIAKDLKLERFILVGTSYNLKHISEKNYEDIFEALCAAIYLECGEDNLSLFLKQTLIYYFENNMLDEEIDYKTKFQELMQRNGKNVIKYITKDLSNEEKHFFSATVVCDDIQYGTGCGCNKHEATTKAAKDALEKLATQH